MKKQKRSIKEDSILSEVIRQHPSLRGKIAEFFGKRCLSCRSSTKETIAYTAFNRGYRPEEVVRELNALLASGKGKGSGSRG